MSDEIKVKKNYVNGLKQSRVQERDEIKKRIDELQNSIWEDEIMITIHNEFANFAEDHQGEVFKAVDLKKNVEAKKVDLIKLIKSSEARLEILSQEIATLDKILKKLESTKSTFEHPAKHIFSV